MPLALGAQAAFPPVGVPGHVGGEPDALGADLARQLDRLGHRVAASDDQVAAAFAQRLAQLGQALVEEAGAVRGELRKRRVEHVERHHPVERRYGRRERRVVVHPQVAGEQHDGRTLGHPARAGVSAGPGTRTGVPVGVSSDRAATDIRRRCGTRARRTKTSKSWAATSSRMPP